MLKRPIFLLVFTFLVVFGVGGCGSTGSTSTDSTPPASAPSPSAVPSPVSVKTLATTVSPDSLGGIGCGSTASFTFSTVITAGAGSSGGQVAYTWNIGSSHIPGSVTFAPGDTTKTVTYTLKTAVQPNTAAAMTGSLSMNNNGSTLTSPVASVRGICSFPGAFKVTSITLTVSPAAVTGIICTSYITFVYTATITIAPNTNGGTVLLKWSFSNTSAAVTFGPYQPGQTTKTVTYSLTGKVSHNQVFPPAGSISSITPNALSSGTVKPFGPCFQ
jgi:hypothetical protein